jgi:lipoate-protein ligase B
MNEAICNRKSGAAALAIRDCGLMPYGEALRLQLELCERRQADAIDNTVLLVEHPAVITLGARKTENRLLSDRGRLDEQGIEVVAVGRGGGTTAHNPGQIVVYPIVKLKSLGLVITEYVRQLEAIGIGLLAEYGVTAGRRKGYPGLWVGEKKIGSIGVQVKKWVTVHGMAINVCNDLGIFEHIVPCGLEGVCMTSVATLSKAEISMADVKTQLGRLLVEAFASEERVRDECSKHNHGQDAHATDHGQDAHATGGV